MKKKTKSAPEIDLDTPLTKENVSGVVDAVIAVSKERAKILEAMKAALLRGDDDEALERARELTGLPLKRSPKAR